MLEDRLFEQSGPVMAPSANKILQFLAWNSGNFENTSSHLLLYVIQLTPFQMIAYANQLKGRVPVAILQYFVFVKIRNLQLQISEHLAN